MKKLSTVLLLTTLFLSQQSFAMPTQEELQRYNLYYNNGVSNLKNKKYSSAIVEFKKVLRYQPYDLGVKQSLCTAYLARADYNLNTLKSPKKAIIDLKSALFYLEFWGKDQTEQLATLTTQTKTSLASLQRKYEANLTPQQKFQNAKSLRAQGELPAAGFDFMTLSNNSQLAKNSLENAGDIYKALNNGLNAIDCYRSALDIDPKNAKLHFKYAVILDEANNQDAAAEEYNLALKYGEKNPELLDILENLWRSRTVANPNNAQAYVNLGTVFQTKGDLTNAKIQYQKALALDFNDKTAHLNLASLYTTQGLTQQAIAEYDKLLAKNPNDTEIINYKALAYENSKNYNWAIAQYKLILAIDPNNKNAKIAIDDIVANKLTPEQKTNYMLEQANSNPSNYDLQYAYAYEMHKQNKYGEAIKYYKKASQINPKKPENYINIAQIYILENNLQEALKIIEQGVKAIPYSAELLAKKDELEKSQAGELYNNATKYYETKNYKQALNEYLKIAQQTPEVQMAIASCFFELKDYQNAIKYYEKSLSTDPKNEEALYFCAIAYNELQNTQRALEILNKIIAQNPTNTDAKNAINAIKQGELNKILEQGIALFEAQNYLEALANFENVLSKESKNTYALYYKGLIFEQQQKLKEAISQYKLAINSDNNFALAHYSYAVALDNSENYKEAVVAYDNFINLKTKLGENDEYLTFAQNRVKELKDFLNGK